MSSGTGWRMISLKKSSPRRILLSQSIGSSGRLGSHQNSPRSAMGAEAKVVFEAAGVGFENGSVSIRKDDNDE